MQNHVEITSKSKFGTRNVRNFTKGRHLLMSKATLDSINQETHMGKYMEHIYEIYTWNIYIYMYIYI